MQHSYDLVLQGLTPADAVLLEPLVAALNARKIVVSPEGRGLWKFGGDEVRFSALMEGGVLKGLDVRVPFHDKTEMLETVVKELLEVATATNLRVMDPQRNDAVTLTSLSAVVDEYLRMARYAGEYGGVSAALGLSPMAAPEQDSSSFRWLLLLMVFSVALYLSWRTVAMLQTARDMERERREEQQQQQVEPVKPPRK